MSDTDFGYRVCASKCLICHKEAKKSVAFTVSSKCSKNVHKNTDKVPNRHAINVAHSVKQAVSTKSTTNQ